MEPTASNHLTINSLIISLKENREFEKERNNRETAKVYCTITTRTESYYRKKFGLER